MFGRVLNTPPAKAAAEYAGQINIHPYQGVFYAMVRTRHRYNLKSFTVAFKACCFVLQCHIKHVLLTGILCYCKVSLFSLISAPGAFFIAKGCKVLFMQGFYNCWIYQICSKKSHFFSFSWKNWKTISFCIIRCWKTGLSWFLSLYCKSCLSQRKR